MRNDYLPAAGNPPPDDLIQQPYQFHAGLCKGDGHRERWPDVATADAVTGTDTFREFLPQLFPHFAGNETVILREV